MKVNIVRFELYPSENPTGYVVGVNVDCENGRSFYKDTIVSFAEIKEGTSDEDIVKYAYGIMKDAIMVDYTRLTAKSSILGSFIVEDNTGDITIDSDNTPDSNITPSDNTTPNNDETPIAQAEEPETKVSKKR